MVLQIGTDPAQVVHEWNSQLPQMLARADSGTHQQSRRLKCAGTEDDLTCSDSQQATIGGAGQCCACLPPFKLEALDRRAREDAQVGPPACDRIEVGNGCRDPAVI